MAHHQPETLAWADRLEDDAVWSAHEQFKLELLTEVNARTGIALDPAKSVLGFARRMTGYKRHVLHDPGLAIG